MKRENIDPWLLAQVENAGETREVEAIVLLAEQEQTAEASASVGHLVLHRVIKTIEQQPTSVHFLPHLGVLYVKGSGRFVGHLLEQDEVVAATADETDIEQFQKTSPPWAQECHAPMALTTGVSL